MFLFWNYGLSQWYWSNVTAWLHLRIFFIFNYSFCGVVEVVVFVFIVVFLYYRFWATHLNLYPDAHNNLCLFFCSTFPQYLCHPLNTSEMKAIWLMGNRHSLTHNMRELVTGFELWCRFAPSISLLLCHPFFPQTSNFFSYNVFYWTILNLLLILNMVFWRLFTNTHAKVEPNSMKRDQGYCIFIGIRMKFKMIKQGWVFKLKQSWKIIRYIMWVLYRFSKQWLPQGRSSIRHAGTVAYRARDVGMRGRAL